MSVEPMKDRERATMNLSPYFENDDGSLPEIEVGFPTPAHVVAAFRYLFERGGRNVSVGGVQLWMRESGMDMPFTGPEDAAHVASGAADSFHVVLADLAGTATSIPDLGVFVEPALLTFDYRMGPEWGDAQIGSLLALLVELRALGGSVSVPWWGEDGERHFLAMLEAWEGHGDDAIGQRRWL